MERGKVSSALKCIGSQETSLLDVSQDVLEDLKLKHPESQPAVPESLLQGTPKRVEEVIFENIDSDAIYKAAKHVNGAAGPSGADADLWLRLLCSKQFKKKPANLCAALADLARKLNTRSVHPAYLRAFVASRLVPLDKKPGVRPIGIGEISRRIVSSATVSVLKPEMVRATAPLQTCAGLRGGIEASIHAMRQIFEDPETEAVLLIDASNAFNALNRKAALHNVQFTCPEMTMFVRNLYRCDAELFIAGSDECILSREGTTQGGPESMAFYATSTMPLARSSPTDEPDNSSSNVKRIFYADDGSGGGRLNELHRWWRHINEIGPPLGYFPKAEKTWLIVKPQHLERANVLFPDIKITTVGHEFLGSYIGNEEGTTNYVNAQISEWTKDIDALIEVAKYEPQLAYIAYVFGTSRRWQFLCRTTPGIAATLSKLEDQIKGKLIPAIFGERTISDDLRKVCSLPARLGGLGLLNPVEEATHEYECSKIMTQQITEAIYLQHEALAIDEKLEEEARIAVKGMKQEKIEALKEELSTYLSPDLLKLINLSAEKGASIWLTSLPLKEYGFRLSKQEFEDALCMRYDLRMKDVPRTCVCGDQYTINHCLTCKNGGFVNIRHNAVRDTAAELMKEVCKDVKVEPPLLQVTGEVLPQSANKADGARADVSALSFWNPLCRAFFDVVVFNPQAPSNWNKEIPRMYSNYEQSKKRSYNERIMQVDRGSFTPLVFSCTGGAGTEATVAMKRLAEKRSLKRLEPYSQVMSFIRRRFRFDILRSCVISLRGERRRSPGVDAAEIADVELGLQRLDFE